MRLFACPTCGGRLFFRNLGCGACGTEVAFDPEAQAFRPLAETAPCANRAEIACPWQAEAGGACRSCAMTAVVPDAFHGENRALWASAEHAKRWTLAGLGRWGWFAASDPGPRPIFHLLAEDTPAGPAAIVMGHADGVVTINVTEADPVERVERREALGELQRTMLGHFRHEIAHFLFLRLAERAGFLEAFRALMGDERADYAAALERHYAEGPPPDHASRFVTAYASAHPHEDWAESAAHVMHLTDIADSAAAARLTGHGLPRPGYDAYAERDPARLVVRAVRLGIATNHVNRAMGVADIYPFVLGATVRRKLAAVHRRLAAGPGA